MQAAIAYDHKLDDKTISSCSSGLETRGRGAGRFGLCEGCFLSRGWCPLLNLSGSSAEPEAAGSQSPCMTDHFPKASGRSHLAGGVWWLLAQCFPLEEAVTKHIHQASSFCFWKLSSRRAEWLNETVVQLVHEWISITLSVQGPCCCGLLPLPTGSLYSAFWDSPSSRCFYHVF